MIFPCARNFLVVVVVFLGIALDSRISQGQTEKPIPPVTALAFSPHGDFLAVGSQQGVTLLNWPSQKVAAQIAQPPSAVHAILWDSDRFTVVGGVPGESGYAGTTQAQALESQLQRHDGALEPLTIELKALNVRASDVIYHAAWSADHQKIALASLDASLEIIDGNTGRTIGDLEGHSSGVTGVCWLNEDIVSSCSRDATLRLWNVSQGCVVRTLNHHTDQTLGMERAPHNNSLPVIATYGLDRTVRFWQPLIGRMMRFVRLEGTVGTAIAWCDSGKTLVVGTRNGHVLKIDALQAKIHHDVRVSDDWIVSLACLPAETVVCGTASGEVLVVEFP